MPATPYAKILISLDDGPFVPGGVLATNGQSVQLGSESVLDWPSNPPPRWEIYAYPEGWAGPSGPDWFVEPKPTPYGGTYDVFVFLGVGPPPAFDLPALPLWGDFMFRLVLADGLLNGVFAPQLQDESAGVRVPSPAGLVDTAPRTTIQFDKARAWAGALQKNWRVLDTLIGGLSSPYVSIPEVVNAGLGSAGVVAGFSRGDHRHQVLTGAAGIIAIGTSAAAGSSSALARADHVHEVPGSFLLPVTLNAGSGSAGSSQVMAREDHKHEISIGVPVSVGLANAVGVSSGFARADHVHGLTFPPVKAALAVADDEINVNGQPFSHVRRIEFDAATVAGIAVEPINLGPGSDFPIRGQAGAPGNPGGALNLGGGDGGDPTMPMGDVQIELGDVGGTSARLSSRANGTQFFGLYLDGAGPEVALEVTAPIRVDVPGFGKVIGIGEGVMFGEEVTAPAFTQDDVTLGGATAPILFVSAANATGASSIGGDTRVGGALGTLKNGNVGLGGNPSAGGGGRVVFVANATTVPTSNPSNGSLLWAENSVELRTPTGVRSTAAPALASGLQPTHVRRRHQVMDLVQTSNATPLTAISYAMPTSSIARFVAEVVAYGPSGGSGAGYKIERTFRREGSGNAVAVGSAPAPVPEEDVAGWDAAIVASGANVTVVVTGAAATVINWTVALEASLLYSP